MRSKTKNSASNLPPVSFCDIKIFLSDISFQGTLFDEVTGIGFWNCCKLSP